MQTKIAVVFEQEYRGVVGEKDYSSLNFSMSCNDGSMYETESVGLFDESTINTKRVGNIEFSFKDYGEDKEMRLRLTNGNYSYGNELEIKGTDSNLVNGCLAKLKEIVESCQHQINITKISEFFLLLISSFSIGIVLLSVIVWANDLLTSKPFRNPITLISEGSPVYLACIFITCFSNGLDSFFLHSRAD